MRCQALFCAVTAAFAVNLDDSSELFQSSALVLEDPVEASKDPMHSMKLAIQKMKGALQQEVADLTREAVKEELARQSETAAAAPAVPVTPAPVEEPATSAAPVAEAAVLVEKKQPAEEHSRYGKTMQLVVRLPSGKEFTNDFHSETNLQVFMHSACNKLHVSPEKVKFSFEGRDLNPRVTPAEFGLKAGDVVEAGGELLQSMYEAEQEAVKKAEEDERMAERMHEAQAKAKEAQAKQKHRVQKKNEEVKAEAQRKEDIKTEGRVSLQFVEHSVNVEGESVTIAAKSENWLQGTLELAAKRLGVDASKVRFIRAENKAEIKPHDSAKSLGLKDMEKIFVKIPYTKK